MKKLEAYLRAEKNKSTGREDRGQPIFTACYGTSGFNGTGSVAGELQESPHQTITCTGEAHHLATDILFEYDATGTSS